MEEHEYAERLVEALVKMTQLSDESLGMVVKSLDDAQKSMLLFAAVTALSDFLQP